MKDNTRYIYTNCEAAHNKAYNSKFNYKPVSVREQIKKDLIKHLLTLKPETAAGKAKIQKTIKAIQNR